jgi:hypothetical protein
MSNRLVIWLATFCIASIAFLFFINSLSMIWSQPNEKFLSYNGVRGMAITHNDTLYTLNFEQQNTVIAQLNLSNPFETQDNLLQSPPFTNLIVYLFNEPDVVLTPLGYNHESLVFSAPQWNKGRPLIVPDNHLFKQILETSYE